MDSRITFLKRPEDHIFRETKEEVEEIVDLTIIIEWENGGPISFFLHNIKGLPAWVKTKKNFSLNEIKSYIEVMEFHLRESSACAEKSSSGENVLMRLQSIGKQLATLVPNKVREILNTLPVNSVIHIETVECWIPWEFVYDQESQTFWGEKYIIGRQLMVNLDDENFQAPVYGCEKPSNDLSSFEIVNAVGNISEINASKDLFNIFIKGNYPQVHTNKADCKQYFSLADLKLKASLARVLNFTCHCLTSPGGRYLQLGPNEIDHHLYTFMVGELSLNECLVFMNACSSGSPSFLFDDILSFGQEFIKIGAETFIGTIAPVPTKNALEIAIKFYRHLLNEGRSTGEALFLAKQESREERDPFWLYYCLFGETGVKKQLRYS
jgi:hypothetical protein